MNWKERDWKKRLALLASILAPVIVLSVVFPLIVRQFVQTDEQPEPVVSTTTTSTTTSTTTTTTPTTTTTTIPPTTTTTISVEDLEALFCEGIQDGTDLAQAIAAQNFENLLDIMPVCTPPSGVSALSEASAYCAGNVIGFTAVIIQYTQESPPANWHDGMLQLCIEEIWPKKQAEDVE